MKCIGEVDWRPQSTENFSLIQEDKLKHLLETLVSVIDIRRDLQPLNGLSRKFQKMSPYVGPRRNVLAVLMIKLIWTLWLIIVTLLNFVKKNDTSFCKITEAEFTIQRNPL